MQYYNPLAAHVYPQPQQLYQPVQYLYVQPVQQVRLVSQYPVQQVRRAQVVQKPVQYQYVQQVQQVRPVYQYQVRPAQKQVRYLQYQQKPIAQAQLGNYVRNLQNGSTYSLKSYELDKFGHIYY